MDNKQDHINEPDTAYGEAKPDPSRITFFSSFSEEREAQYKYWRSLTPEQRMEEHRVLSLYAFSSYEKYTGNRLTFD